MAYMKTLHSLPLGSIIFLRALEAGTEQSGLSIVEVSTHAVRPPVAHEAFISLLTIMYGQAVPRGFERNG